MESKQKTPDLFWRILSIILLVVIVGLVCLQLFGQEKPKYVYYENPNTSPTSELVAIAPPMNVDHDSIYWIADLADKALPFVVNVQAIYEQEEQPAKSEDVRDMFRGFEDILPEGMRDRLDDNETYELPSDHPPIAGEGSGFIVREDGYIVTNAHVVEGASSYVIHFNDGSEKDADLIGMDQFKDIAVLKVDGGDLPVATLGDSERTRIGEPVIAIGSPLGFEATVTSGIVSTTRRDIEELGRSNDIRRPQSYIQTDAAINRGNSGGPLLNANGEVIGVNQAIIRYEPSFSPFSRGVPIEGIGFAIPINEVKNTITQIIKDGKVSYPGISAEIISVEDFLRLEPNIKLSVDHGVMLRTVIEDGPAHRAGIEAGDVVLSVNDTEVYNTDDFISMITAMSVGDRITLRVARQGGEEIERISVVLGELDISRIHAGE